MSETDFNTEADKLVQAPKKRVKRAAHKAAVDKTAAAPKKRAKRASRLLAYQIQPTLAADDLEHPAAPIVRGAFETHEAMIENMAEVGVAPGDQVVVFREIRRGPVKTKTWIG